MKQITLTICLAALSAAMLVGSGSAFAADAKPAADKSTAATAAPTTSTEKKSRKKKALMCNECGKPESECECKGHKDGHKDSKKHEHTEGEDHAH